MRKRRGLPLGVNLLLDPVLHGGAGNNNTPPVASAAVQTAQGRHSHVPRSPPHF